MAERDILQIQLPASALGTLARILEQVQRLSSGQDAKEESGGSSSFDQERFRELAAAAPSQAETRISEPDSAKAPPMDSPSPAEAAFPSFSDIHTPAVSSAETTERGQAQAAAQPRGEIEPPQMASPEAVTEISPAASVRPQASARPPAPLTVQAAGLDMGDGPVQPKGGHMAMAEELTDAGPAPLTAQAVSIAFQRDDRRYDAGFPLY